MGQAESPQWTGRGGGSWWPAKGGLGLWFVAREGEARAALGGGWSAGCGQFGAGLRRPMRFGCNKGYNSAARAVRAVQGQVPTPGYLP